MPDLPERPQDQRRRRDFKTSRVQNWEKALAKELDQKLSGEPDDADDLQEVQVLRDPSQRVLGTIRKRGDDTLEVRNSSNAFRGSYDPNTDETRDTTGRLIGTGNLLAALLVNEVRRSDIAEAWTATSVRQMASSGYGTNSPKGHISVRGKGAKLTAKVGSKSLVGSPEEVARFLNQELGLKESSLQVVTFSRKGAARYESADPIMEPGFVKTPADEKKWARAKAAAKKSNPDNMYAVANHIFQNMKKSETVEEAKLSPSDANSLVSHLQRAKWRAKVNRQDSNTAYIQAVRDIPSGGDLIRAIQHAIKSWAMSAYLDIAVSQAGHSAVTVKISTPRSGNKGKTTISKMESWAEQFASQLDEDAHVIHKKHGLSSGEVAYIAKKHGGSTSKRKGILKVTFAGPSSGVNLELFRSEMKKSGEEFVRHAVEWMRGKHKKAVVTFKFPHEVQESWVQKFTEQLDEISAHQKSVIDKRQALLKRAADIEGRMVDTDDDAEWEKLSKELKRVEREIQKIQSSYH